MINSTHTLVTNLQFMFIPIGKVVQHIFQNIKPAGSDNFLRLYVFIISNILWVIVPLKDKKINSVGKSVWNVTCMVLFFIKIYLFLTCKVLRKICQQN